MREKIKKWWRARWRGFTGKQKLAVVDSGDGAVKWYMYISPARILIGAVMLLLMIFVAVVLVVAYTPVMDTIPGYPGAKSREQLIRGIMRLDSLEREMAHLTVYSDNIALIMEGKTPVIRDVSRIGDSIQMADKALVPPSLADSLLRARMEGTGEYSLAGSASAARSSEVAADFVPPAAGLVQARFSPVEGRFGVEIVTTSNHPVVAVREGSVILGVWTPDEGNIVQVQHAGNLVSVYRRLAEVRPAVGARVKAGETIGVSEGLVEFELWNNGTAVDPENYIVF